MSETTCQESDDKFQAQNPPLAESIIPLEQRGTARQNPVERDVPSNGTQIVQPPCSTSWFGNLFKKWSLRTESLEEMEKRMDEELRIYKEQIRVNIEQKKVTTAAEIKHIKRDSTRRIIQVENEQKEAAYNYALKYSTPQEIERYHDAQSRSDGYEVSRDDGITNPKKFSKI